MRYKERMDIREFRNKFYFLFDASKEFYSSHTDRINFLHKYLKDDYKKTASYSYLSKEGKKEYLWLCKKENLTDYFQHLCHVITTKAEKGEIYDPFL